MLYTRLLLLAAMMFPGLAQATSLLNPSRGNSWDLYVFGNGRVIHDILMGIKMLMTPDAGSTGFTTLLLLMATIGFVCLAVAAGFDPAKNLMKMFGYIFVVWMVSLFSTQIVANVSIHDLVVDKDGLSEEYVVSRVPAIVAVPAALTSEVGYYFTRVLETYFTVPSDFKMTGSAAGQFNLFSKMIEESNEYGFRYPELKKSLSAYTADCVIPAIAMKRVRTPAKGADGKDLTGAQGEYIGISALLRSTNLMETYATAKLKAVMTTYYPVTSPDYVKSGGKLETSSQAPSSAMGTVMGCDVAYDKIVVDMTASAQSLLNEGTDAWKKSGIMVPFETAMNSMLQTASANGSVGAGFTRPSGYVMQQSFLNSMSGSFRTAALQTGNSELIQAANLSMAEASQKSAWVAGFSMFNNMMGYVFTVLQAFIFAITPMIVVALLIPGLGKGIFVNYTQILIWLTLWMPMLALINFIITLFGAEASANVLSFDGGLSQSNKGLFVEKTKNLVIAAQFLGTMTPMITWGIVKGAMAFTEFISSGIGSSFSNSAGAAAASGNLSMNNMSLDNTSMNKYNTAFASTVGFQSTNTFAGAGANLVSQSLGGAVADANGGSISAGRVMQEGISKRMAQSQSVSEGLSWAMDNSTSASDALSKVQGSDRHKGNTELISVLKSMALTSSQNKGGGTDLGKADSSGTSKTTSTAAQNANSAAAETGITATVGTPSVLPASIKGTASVKAAATTSNTSGAATDAKIAENSSAGQKGQQGFVAGATAGTTNGVANSSSDSLTSSDAVKKSHDEQAAFKESAGQAMKKELSYQKGLESMQSFARSSGFNDGMTAARAMDMLHSMDALKASSLTGDELTARMDGLVSKAESNYDGGIRHFGETRDSITSASTAIGGGPPTVAGQGAAIDNLYGAQVKAADTAYASAEAARNASQLRAAEAQAKDDLLNRAVRNSNDTKVNPGGKTSMFTRRHFK